MPNLNLRLSGEEHEALVAAAAANGRSLQREIVWRLFRGREGLWAEQSSGSVRPDQNQVFGSDTSAATGLGVDVPVAVPQARVSYEYGTKECPRRAGHNSLRVCPLCGADSAN